ncbi:MAG: hypothetical protein KAR43_09455 [Deltaproteobacteria bacterium]|nr:hypothetical protein [Deltaproteobacteria bacterium]
MGEAYAFPPYSEKVQELIKKFGGTVMEEYRSYDIKPLWDQKGEGYTGFKYLYKAPKLEKIAFGVGCFREKLMSYALMIWPDDNHALPIYSSYWAESAKGSFFIIDLYPLADCIRDLPYLEKYLAPLEDIYAEGLEHFPPSNVRSMNWFRTVNSPYLITTEADATKENQERLLNLTLDYLKVYIDLWKNEEPSTPEYMKELNARKEAIRKTFMERDSIGDMMLTKALGKELSHLSLITQF